MYFKSPLRSPAPFKYTNIHEYVFHDSSGVLERRGDSTLHIDGVTGKVRTWKEFTDRVKDGITALSAPTSLGGLGLTVGNGEMIGIMSDNCLDYIALVHSLWASTIPIALISSHSTTFELERLMNICHATRLFVHPDALERALVAANKVGLPSDKIYILEGNVPGRMSFGNMIDRVITNRVPRFPCRPAGKDTLAHLVFSSGTSGPPKAVMISHGNILAMMHSLDVAAEIEAVILPPRQYDNKDNLPRNLGFLPLHHCYGLITYCGRLLRVPTTLVVIPRWNIDLVLKLIPKYRINYINLIPSALYQFVNSPKLAQTDLSSLISTHSGAAYLAPDLAKRFTSMVPGASVSDGYGLSETTMTVAYWPAEGVVPGVTPTIGSCGILVPGSEGRILRDDGTEADINEPGNFFFRAPNVCMGYFENEKATKETFFEGGWLKTGDRMRSDGVALYFDDRAKDTLKVSGIQVSPREIEDTMLANPDGLVIDVAVAGVSGGRTSDEKNPRAWVVLSQSAKHKDPKAVIQALNDWTQKSLSKYKWLRGGIEIVDEIPKNPTGKVLRRVLQDRYEQSIEKARSRL